MRERSAGVVATGARNGSAAVADCVVAGTGADDGIWCSAGGCGETGLAATRLWRFRLFVIGGEVGSPVTSARNLAMVSVPTPTFAVASNSWISRNDAPFCLSSIMPSLKGINFA